MAMRLYDLAGADPNLRFSPYCWRAKFALAHKGLAVNHEVARLGGEGDNGGEGDESRKRDPVKDAAKAGDRAGGCLLHGAPLDLGGQHLY